MTSERDLACHPARMHVNPLILRMTSYRAGDDRDTMKGA